MKKGLSTFFLIVSILMSILLIVQVRNSPATAVPEEGEGYSDAAFTMEIPFEQERELQGQIGGDGDAFSSWLHTGRDTSVVPAVVAGVVKNGRMVFHSGSNAGIDTPMGIASLTKTFTAVMALRLAEEGYFSLDDPVRRYLPGVVIARGDLGSGEVTIRHLLAHLSGMPTAGDQYLKAEAGGTVIQFPRQKNPAGLCYAYNNAGYVIAKAVMEKATGSSYDELLKKYITGPLKMTATSGNSSNGTGGIVTTLRDLAKYTTMLINGGRYGGKQIITRASFHEMLAPQVELPATDVDYYYSLGWEVITVEGRVDSYYKAGRWYGEASAIQVFPEKKTALIYLCNPPRHLTPSFMRWRQSLTGRLRNLVRKIEDDPSLCSKWPVLSPEQMKWYEGSYENILTGRVIEVRWRNDALMSSAGSPPQPLHVFTSNRLLMGEGNLLHNFVWKDGRVVGLALSSGYYRLIP